MSEVGQFLKEMLSLTSSMGELKSDVRTLAAKTDNLVERIIRLEQREEVLMERMSRHAVEAVHRMTKDYFEKVTTLQKRVELVENGKAVQPKVGSLNPKDDA